MSLVKITVGPRIHIALADMGFITHRNYCGVGISIDEPQVTVCWTDSVEFELRISAKLPVAIQSGFRAVFDRLRDYGKGGLCEVISTLPHHAGYGSSTATMLSIIVGFNILHKMGWSKREMLLLSGRGGVSGIGVNSFFSGGVIWDAGHMQGGDPLELKKPSRMRAGFKPPCVLGRWSFPNEWQVLLFSPPSHSISGAAEQRFFSDNLPISRSETCATLAALYHGVIPAIVLNDLELLAMALRDVASAGFKAREIAAQSDVTRELLRAMLENGFAAGMSSIGPLIYIICRKSDTAQISRALDIAKVMGVSCEGKALGRNRGFRCETGS